MGEKKKTAKAEHKALYRKYRSKSLNEIVGQEHITKTLASAIKNKKINHAYLFTGPRGTGKTSIARILAHEVNNLPYEDESIHLDIIEIDAASNRRIDDIRELRDKVHIAPVSATYKVYIIDEVHMLTPESFNALLKTLEEPPKHVIFILATTEVHKLPATIISRAQRHGFRLIPIEKVADHLASIAKQEDLKIEKAALELLAEHGGGSFRDSISLLDQMSSAQGPITVDLIESTLGLASKNTLLKLLNSLKSGNTSEMLEVIEELVASGLTPTAISEQLLKIIREEIKHSPNQKLIDLMNGLFDVQSAQYQQLKLESILLKAAVENSLRDSSKPPSAPKPAVISQPQMTASVQKSKLETATDKDEKEEVKETKIKKPIAKEEKVKALDVSNFSEIWPEIVHIVKQKNNSLYTVLRLATADFEDSTLKLGFKFSFHQKRANESKNKSLLAEIIHDKLGIQPEIVAEIDKNISSEPKVQKKVDPAHASLISTVQDIMGGGEIINAD